MSIQRWAPSPVIDWSYLPWHILGDRLIPCPPLLSFDRGILHVGPTKSLTALVLGTEQGCHVTIKINHM